MAAASVFGFDLREGDFVQAEKEIMRCSESPAQIDSACSAFSWYKFLSQVANKKKKIVGAPCSYISDKPLQSCS